MVPGTTHGLLHHEALRERSAVMRTGRTDCKEVVAAAREEHSILADVTCKHSSVKEVADRYPLGKVGPGRFRLRCAHDDLLGIGSRY
jgi:hypothetical protein